MMKKRILIVLPLLVLAGIAVFLSGCNQESFSGSRVKNPDAYLLDIQKMNGTDLHTLELCEGDVLQYPFRKIHAGLTHRQRSSDRRGRSADGRDFEIKLAKTVFVDGNNYTSQISKRG